MGTAEVNGKLWGARPREWADLHEVCFKPLYSHAFAATKVGAGTRYLDVGCGAGLALSIAAGLGAKVSGLDASAGLLGVARERVRDGDIRQGEIEELPFADGSFDVVTGFNSFQYASKAAHALREAARVTKKGGYVVIATWSPPDLTEAAKVLAALKPLMPPPPPNVTPPGPFALSDEATLKGLAAEAKLTPLVMHDVECPFVNSDLASAVRAFNSSGVAARAMGQSGEEAVTRAHEAALRQFVRPDGTVFVPNRFRYLMSEV